MSENTSYFESLGIYGFGGIEPLIIASLITEDPILLTGNSGTGKTLLLNNISRALGLVHRHYNASLVSFDDLVGFPFPDKEMQTISFLQTPATIWQAESVLVDEISRARPETQNKFFSIIHERKLQGLPAEKLVYRWAAMNPFQAEGSDNEEQYTGSMALDPALADRFAFIIPVPDWSDLSPEDQARVADPSEEIKIPGAVPELQYALKKLKAEYKQLLLIPNPETILYVRAVTSLLNQNGIRISPRRARILTRNILAAYCAYRHRGGSLSINFRKEINKQVLFNSLPHRAWLPEIPWHTINSAHSEAIRIAMLHDDKQRWISELFLLVDLNERIKTIFTRETDMDTISLATTQMLTMESRTRAAIFAFITFPLFAEARLLHAEAFCSISRLANSILNINNAKLEWRELNRQGYPSGGGLHPTWSACQKVINQLPASQKGRKDRARQLFLYLLTNNENIPEPVMVEQVLQKCFETARKLAAKHLLAKI